jgi:hypothetical protein
VGTAGIPIGVRIATATTMPSAVYGQHRHGRQHHAVEAAAHTVGEPDARGDHGQPLRAQDHDRHQQQAERDHHHHAHTHGRSRRRAARLCASLGLPLLPIQMGRLGALAELETYDVEALVPYLHGDCYRDERLNDARPGLAPWMRFANRWPSPPLRVTRSHVEREENGGGKD